MISMRLSRFAVLALAGAMLHAQQPPAADPAATNPHLGKPDSIRAGMMLYRVRCADCHGLDASGYRGPDLMALLAGGVTDQRLFQTMRKGVPGTEMPSSTSPDDELLHLLVRKLDVESMPNVSDHSEYDSASLCS